MKKILLFICSFLLLFSVASCEFSTSGTTESSYKLTYYDEEGNVLNLLPSSYKANAHVKLPKGPDKEGYTFVGWLINNHGDTYNEFDGKIGSLKLYASYEEGEAPTPVDPVTPVTPTTTYENPYQKVLKANYTYTCGDFTYYENGNISHYVTKTEDVYFKTENDGTYSKYTKDTTTNEYVKSTINESQKMSALVNAGYVNFKGLDTQFVKENNTLTNTTSANTIGQTLFNNSSSYKSITVKLNNNVVTEVIATLADNSTISVIISKYDQTITIPYTEHVDVDSNILEALNASDGETVTVTGYVTGTVGYNFYISDGENGLYIYPNVSTYRDVVKVGETLTITGKMTTYNGLRELGTITNIVKASAYTIASVPTLNSLTNVSSYQYLPINLHGMMIAETPNIDSAFKSGSKDAKLQITDGANTYLVLFHKSLSTTVKTAIYDDLCALEEGMEVNFDNIIVSYYNGIQFAFTNEASFMDVTTYEEKLMASRTSISSEAGKTLADLLKNVTFTKQETDGTITSVGYSDLTFTTYDNTYIGTQTVTASLGELSVTLSIYLYEAGAAYRPTDVETLDDVLPNMGVEDGITYGVTGGIPNTGDPKILVIPVTFTNYPAPSGMVETLNKAFFGTSEDTGWESLQSYYLKSSFGKLNITGTVLEPYNTGKTSTYYTTYNDEDAVNLIIHAALSYYDSTIDFSEYDTDNDGYIDGIYLVYTCPVDYEGDSLYWAFTYEYYTDDYEYYDGVEADYYCFFGMDFLDEELANGSYVNINCETIIHESGHMLGLDDYYDYDDSVGPDGGLGGSDMMDYNIGDHNSYSKAILGWINPYVVNGYDTTITIGKTNATGDAIIVCNNWNDTYFDEYLLIEYYTPDGLNALEAGYNGQFSIAGIKIYHVDANLGKATDVWEQWSVTENDNSSSTYKLIGYVEADGNNDIATYNAYSEDADLFQEGDTYFLNKWNNKQTAGITITIEEVGDTAVISITFNN